MVGKPIEDLQKISELMQTDETKYFSRNPSKVQRLYFSLQLGFFHWLCVWSL